MGNSPGLFESSSTLSSHLVKLLREFRDTPPGVGFGAQHPLWGVLQDLGRAMRQLEPVHRRPTLKVEPSGGQGRKARIPWVALMDTRETTSTQRGVYCVFLFREDMSGLYLTLAQGVTEPRRTSSVVEFQQFLRDRVGVLRSHAREAEAHGFRLDDGIDLRGTERLAHDYEASVAAYRFYEPTALPDDAALAQDLEVLLQVYDRYLASGRGAREDAPAVSDIATAAPVRTWLFQANPRLFNLRKDLVDPQGQDDDQWTVSRYADRMQPGDRVLLWEGGKDAGLLAIGEIVGRPKERLYDPANLPAWVKPGRPDIAVPFRYTARIDPPILKDVLLSHPVLKSLSILHAPMGTNFRVTPEQWQALEPLLTGRLQAPRPPRRSADGSVSFREKEHDEQSLPRTASPTEPPYVEPPFETIVQDIAAAGLRIDVRKLREYHLGLKTRGFVILAGLSGSGKTWLAQVYAQVVGANCRVIAVAPNWNTNEDLLGFPSPLNSVYHDTPFSEFLREAADEWGRRGKDARPYHLLLDEMNLARVEYYFATFLSAMELRARAGTAELHLGQARVALTPNLRFVGTVNVDETTFTPADKVYDRAQLVEIGVSRATLAQHLDGQPYHDEVMRLWDHLHDVAPFAFRVLDEIRAYVEQGTMIGVPWREALDEQIVNKILPKMKGADDRAEGALAWLVEWAQDDFPLSHAKASLMLARRRSYGVASYF